jgi:hypothetical protein
MRAAGSPLKRERRAATPDLRSLSARAGIVAQVKGAGVTDREARQRVLYVVACGGRPAGDLPAFAQDAQRHGWEVLRPGASGPDGIPGGRGHRPNAAGCRVPAAPRPILTLEPSPLRVIGNFNFEVFPGASFGTCWLGCWYPDRYPNRYPDPYPDGYPYPYPDGYPGHPGTYGRRPRAVSQVRASAGRGHGQKPPVTPPRYAWRGGRTISPTLRAGRASRASMVLYSGFNSAD